MMLLRRWGVAAALGLSLMLGAANAQTAKPSGHVVQPDDGPPPDQAVQPEPPAQYEHANDPEQPPEPEPVVPPPVEKPVVVEAAPSAEPQPEPTRAPAPQHPAAAAVTEQAPAIHKDDKPQSQLQKDTAALLQLTEDLRAEIEKAGNDTLSVAAIRKADEIQKLSKNLRERLKDQEQVPVTK